MYSDISHERQQSLLRQRNLLRSPAPALALHWSSPGALPPPATAKWCWFRLFPKRSP
jgi:hypothetical protein